MLQGKQVDKVSDPTSKRKQTHKSPESDSGSEGEERLQSKRKRQRVPVKNGKGITGESMLNSSVLYKAHPTVAQDY